MAIKISYTHGYDHFWKLCQWFLGTIALFVSAGIAYIVSLPLQDISEGLRFILGIIIFIFGLILLYKLIFSGDYLPTKWYVENNFNIKLDKKECEYLSIIFSGNRWYPLKELIDIPESQRKEALFSIAKEILGYEYNPAMFENKKKEFKLPLNKHNILGKYTIPSGADDLQKYNNLLKEGAITQEEYNKIKIKILEKVI